MYVAKTDRHYTALHHITFSYHASISHRHDARMVIRSFGMTTTHDRGTESIATCLHDLYGGLVDVRLLYYS
jgi:hypothetical protein